MSGAWSEWQTLPPSTAEARKMTLMQDRWERPTPDYPWVYSTGLLDNIYWRSPTYPLRTNQYSFPTIASPGHEQAERTMQQYKAFPTWETDRQRNMLDNLTEGVDYMRIPGRVSGDQWEFIDYEPGLNQHIGWEPFSATMMQTWQAQPGQIQETWRIGFGVGLSPALPDDAPIPPPLPFSIGTVFYNSVAGTAAGSIPVMPDDPSPATEFWFAIEMTNDQIEHTDGYGMFHDGYNAFLQDVVIETPVQIYQMPRWRYWIPSVGVPSMRQRQRDDGLTTDSRHERGQGSSFQSSQRRGGRVYY